MFEATLRSGTIWRSDAELLDTLPQGAAKLATLQTREFMARAKVKAKAKAKSKTKEEPPREEPTDGTHSTKRPRTLRQMFQSSAFEQVGGEHGEAAARVDDCGEDIGSDVATHSGGLAKDENTATTPTDLFAQGKDEDKALLEGLRERPTHPRCVA